MAATSIAPQEEVAVEKKTNKVCESKPMAPKPQAQNLVAKIFEGHEEFLGWTPD